MIRKSVMNFAEIKEQKLRENDHKGGWNRSHISYLTRRMREEEKELNKAITQLESPDVVDREAADVSNFAMMIAERYRIIYGNKQKRSNKLKEVL